MDVSKLDMDAVLAVAEEMDGGGFCIACGAEAEGVEPDARHCKCEACGRLEVFGAEQIILEGAF